MNLRKMRDACHRLQWSVDDFDWDAPGKPTLEEAREFEGFLTNLAWIETLAEPFFTPLSEQLDDPDLRDIYKTFQVDEKRHGDAELAVMRRWGLLKPGEMPKPPYSLELLNNLSQTHWDRMHPAMLTASIPFLEIMLDGALIPHFATKVKDPLFHEVYDKINADEGRHLTVGFHVIGDYSDKFTLYDQMQSLMKVGDVHLLYGLIFGFLPFMSQTWQSLEDTGMEFKQIEQMLDKYIQLGDDDAQVRKNRVYRVIKMYAYEIKYGKLRLESYLARLSDAAAYIDRGFTNMKSAIKNLTLTEVTI